MSGRFMRLVLAIGCVVLAPAVVSGQGAISGLVRDTSGGAMPGVTVEAASPALIERSRTVVTDASGQYLIADLRPGVYSVTFTLGGFSTLKRDGLEVTTGVTRPVNAELKLGTVEETVTVTTATPVVDVQNTRQVTVLTREVLDVLPRTRVQMYTAALLPGVIITTPGAYQSRRRWKHRQELDVGNRTWRVGRRSNHAGRRNACLRRRGRFPEEFE